MLELVVAGVVVAAALFFAAAWGAAENRLWKEQGEGVILNNFKLYHLCMGLLFGFVNALTVLVVQLLSVAPLLSLQAFTVWLWLMIWDTLMLDVTWWLIRFFDFKVRPSFALMLYYPEKNAWHERADWDNWLGLPLVLGCYWWWYMFAGSLAAIAMVYWIRI